MTVTATYVEKKWGKRMIRTGSDFSGVGAFEQALDRLGIEHKNIFACDIDKYARETFIANYGEPQYFPEDVYEREIPEIPLDIYMTSPPCQAFSMAGHRKGEDDHRGILFYNSHEFIQKNRPRYFIFENVKGLLSDDNGKTFQRWIDFLGGKSVNGTLVMFPHEESVPYHVYWQVLNAKDYGVPQNRERVFIIGIRDDGDNNFTFPRPIPLELTLKDVLQDNPNSKYLMTKEKTEWLYNRERSIGPTDPNKKQVANCVISGYHKIPGDGEYILENTEYMEIPDKYYLSDELVKGFIESSDRHVEKGTGFVWKPKNVEEDIANALRANGALCKTDNSLMVDEVSIGAFRGRNPENNKKNAEKSIWDQTLEINRDGVSNTLSTVQKDNIVVESGTWRTHNDGKGFRKVADGNCPTIPARAREDGSGQPVIKIVKVGEINPSQSGSVYDPNGIAVTITGCGGGHGAKTGLYATDKGLNFLGGTKPHNRGEGKLSRDYSKQDRVYDSEGIAETLPAQEWTMGAYKVGYRIRRLTPRECFRLMDFPDSFRLVCSDTQNYKMAGNSIVVSVLAEIIKKLKL